MEQVVRRFESNGSKSIEDDQSVERWLRPEIERASVDDGTENIAGC